MYSSSQIESLKRFRVLTKEEPSFFLLYSPGSSILLPVFGPAGGTQVGHALGVYTLNLGEGMCMNAGYFGPLQ